MTDQNSDKPGNTSSAANVGKLKVKVERDLCIGAATCVAIAPKAFVLDSDAKAVILDTAGEESDNTILEATRGCPTAAIIVEDKNGRRIFPK